MGRRINFELPTDTAQFSALQLHPRVVTGLGWSALARWLDAYLVPFPRLIGDHHVGMVVLGFSLRYRSLASFFDGERLQIDAGLTARRHGSRAVLDLRIEMDGRSVADLDLLLCPVRIEEPVSLAASPAALPAELLARFNDNERDDSSPVRTLPALREDVESRGRLVGSSEHSFMVHRHLCEVAEQWAWTELPTLTEALRERWVLDAPTPPAAVRSAVSQPLARMDVELTKPYFSFDRGQLNACAYAWRDRLALVHQLTSSAGSHGVVVEHFGAPV